MLNRRQTATPSAGGRSDRDLVGALFAALAAASAFVPLGSTHPAPIEPASQPVPRFRGWIDR